MASLRTRLLAGTVGGMLLLLAVLSLIVYVTIRRTLLTQFDAGLESTARLLAASIEQDSNDVELGIEPEFRDIRQDTYYQLWAEDQTVVAKSVPLHSDNLLQFAGPMDSPAFTDLRRGDGKRLRAIGFRFTPRPADGDESLSPKVLPKVLYLTVARDATELHNQLSFLRSLLLTASAAVTALSLLVAAVVVQRGLAPLNALAAQIGAVRADDLATRVDASRLPAEIAPVRDRLNDLLCRMEAAFDRERRFTADAAHELRTPLAGVRSTIEVALARNREVPEYRTALADCLEITQSMQSMVNRLLMLARLDARQIPLRSEPIRLAELVNVCWRPFADRARERGLVFDNRIAPEVTCQVDREHVAMVFSNLLDNAVEYADSSGRIWTMAHRRGDAVEIVIANTGCQLTREQVAHVWDSFWRGDGSRRDTGTHCGLGLTLVQRLVKALGGHAAAEVRDGGLFTMQLTFPAAP